MEASNWIWVDGRLVPWEEANTHVVVHGLHYGTGVFEGIRAYQTDEGTSVFRLTDHMVRLHRSAAAYGIPLSWSVEALCAATKEVVAANELEACYIRPIVFYGSGSMGLNPDGNEVRAVIACWRWGTYLGEEGVANGIRARISSWRRIDSQSLIPDAKGSGGYLNSILAKQEAARTGYDEAIMLTRDGTVSEGSGENLFAVRDGIVLTPGVGSGVLDGITRRSVMALLADQGHEVRETTLQRSDLYHADEVFLTGTAAEVTPVREIDDRPVGEGKPGSVTRTAQDLYRSAVTGQLPAFRHWLDPV